MAKPFRGIIQDVERPGELIEFFSFEPPQKSHTVVYDDVSIRGRSEPHVFYSHTEAQIWNFTIHFLASFDEGDNGRPANVKEKENFLESFVMPDYGDEAGDFGVVKPPHLARVRILKMFDLIGTIRDLNFQYVPPYDVVTGYPYQIDATFTLHAQRSFGKDPLGYAEIRRIIAKGQSRQL